MPTVAESIVIDACFSSTMCTPFADGYFALQALIGIVRSSWPLEVTVIVCAAASTRLTTASPTVIEEVWSFIPHMPCPASYPLSCLLYTSDAADEEDSVDLGGRRI